uniref:Uncharacterized protein n=1 Tax=Anopheles funestus TaxID=62324 RepID=A0A182RID6_ANOFN
MASIRQTVRRAWPLPLQLIIGGVCVLLMLQDHPHHVAEATIPTIDNIVKILQSPVVQQLILPRPLVAADPNVVADEPATEPASKKDPKKPSHMSDETAKVSSKARQDSVHDEPVRTFLIPRTRSLPGCPLCDASVYSYCDERCTMMRAAAVPSTVRHRSAVVVEALAGSVDSVAKLSVGRVLVEWWLRLQRMFLPLRQLLLRTSADSELLLQFAILERRSDTFAHRIL